MVREPAVTLHLSRLSPSWLDPITSFLENGKLPDDEKDVKKLRREAARCLGRRARLGPLVLPYNQTIIYRINSLSLTYGLDALILVEIGEPSPRLLLKGVEEAVEKDLIDEVREMAHLMETALKQRMALRYNTKVLRREFEPNDLVLRRNDIGLLTPGEGKLTTNWEGPYRVKEVIGKAAFKLERLNGKEIPRTWNASNLRRFYS
ncbi:uncharacterized protein LOC107457906 [Arachis duranensis]|uniref:Uncharacterized protein LOC107457906 n=1 Tax=Arachis duranensis TaxID=130453 RepID=A0A6P4AZU1_ARADU|nr:uncharacterized protein LOC107457906 [Arachis duranensis]